MLGMDAVRTARGLGWPHLDDKTPSRLGWPSNDTDRSISPNAEVATVNTMHPAPPAVPESEPGMPSRPLPDAVPLDDNRGDTPSGPADVSRETSPSDRQSPVHQRAAEQDSATVDDTSHGSDLPTPTHVPDAALRAELLSTVPPSDDDTPLAKALAVDTKRRIALTNRTFPKPTHTRILTVANQKGGVGKTTTAVNIAAALAQSGLQVLVVDLDPQGNASTALGIDHHAGIESVYDVLVDDVPMAEIVQPSPDVDGLFCAPSSIDLAGAEIELVSLVARENRLAKAIRAMLSQTAYDYIFIDCPPSLGLLTINAFVAAQEVFIPIQCEYYALEGVSQLLRNIELIRTHLNPTLAVSTILLTMYDARTRLSAQVADEVRTHFPRETLDTTIPRSVRVSEAPSFGQTVMTYDPLNSGALAYLEAASQIADRGAPGATSASPGATVRDEEGQR